MHPHLSSLHELYLAETQPFRKVHRMIDLFESIIKTHTVVIMSEYVRHNKLSETAKGLLSQGLRTPSLGTVNRSGLKSNNVLRMTSNIGKHVELSFINFFQLPFSTERFSFRWAAQLNVSVKFNSWLSLQLNYQSMYDTNPVVNIPAYYYTSSTGVGFSNRDN
jgi:hypothetical protein